MPLTCSICGDKILDRTKRCKLSSKLKRVDCSIQESLSNDWGVPLSADKGYWFICTYCRNSLTCALHRRKEYNAALSRLYNQAVPSLYIGEKLREFISALRREPPEASSSSSASFFVPAPRSPERTTESVTHKSLPVKKRKFSHSGGKITAALGSITPRSVAVKKQKLSNSGRNIMVAPGSVTQRSIPEKKQRFSSLDGKSAPASCSITLNGNADSHINPDISQHVHVPGNPTTILASAYVKKSRYGKACRLLLQKSSAFRREVQILVRNEIRTEVRKIGKPPSTSVWRASPQEKKLQNLKSFSWKEALSEAKSECPFLYTAVLGAATAGQPKGSCEIDRKLKPALGAALGLLMFLGDPRKLKLQELVGLELWLSHCGPETFKRLHSLGMCTSMPYTKTNTARMVTELDDDLMEKKKELEAEEADISDSSDEPGSDEEESSTIRKKSDGKKTRPSESPDETSSDDRSSRDGTIDYSCLDRADGAIAGFTIIFDDVNEMTRARYSTRTKDDEMPNMVQAYAAFDRVPSYHLDDTPPTADDILQIDPKVYLPNEDDEILLRQEYTVLVQRILTRLMPCFQQFAERVEDHIPHPHFRESKQKSKIVPLGVLFKDETKTSDMVDILRSYHDYVPCIDAKPITTILYGDGLTCVRVRDAQSEAVDVTDSQKRLDGLYPTVQEWHKHCLFLEDTYKLLYDVRSSRAVGTLSYIKYKFLYRNVEPDTAAHSFDAATDLLQLSTEAYVVAAACVQLGLDDPSKMPEDLPEGIEGLHYFHDVSSLVVDMAFEHLEVTESENEPYPYCICHNDIEDEMVLCKNPLCSRGSWFHISCMNMSPEDVPEGKYFCSKECSEEWQKQKGLRFQSSDDHILQYSRAVLFRGLGERARHDAIRENDGERIISHWRFDMIEFHEMHHPKYFIEGFHLLTDVNGGASERVAHQMKWNRTVNMCGGRGHNVSMGFAMNRMNKEFKLAMKACGGNLTPSMMKRYSRILGVRRDLQSPLSLTKSKCMNDLCGSRDMQEDTLKLAKLLLDNDCLKEIPGRSHSGFGDFVFEHALTQQHRFIERIENHKKKRAEHMDTAQENASVTSSPSS